MDLLSVASDDVSCAVVPFRYQGRLWITVIVKARFALVPDGIASHVGAAEIIADEQRVDGNPMRSVEAAIDLAPYLPRCDVTFVGKVYAPGRPAETATARLSLARDGRPFLDKVVHVFGNRGPDGPVPFAHMPLVYERALGGPGEPNPVGTQTPNVVDPADPRRTIGFAPISRLWPSRKRLLGNTNRRALEAPIAEIPNALPWDYFQTAPTDQQVDHLRGDEWLLLDGLHPTLPRVQTRLPAAHGVARVRAQLPGVPPVERQVGMVCDTLAIDGNRQTFALVWRGRVEVIGGEAALPSLAVTAALEVPDREVDWAWLWAKASAPRSMDATAMLSAAAFTGSTAVDSTMALGPAQAAEAVAKMLAPFAVAAAGDAPAKARVEATPFASVPPPSGSEAAFEITVLGPPTAKQEEVGGSTMALQPEQQAAVMQRAVAPFAIQPAGGPGVGTVIPGAPWSSTAAPALAPLVGAETLTLGGGALLLVPPPMLLPLPVAVPSPLVAPAFVAPPSMVRPPPELPPQPEAPIPIPRAPSPDEAAQVVRPAPALPAMPAPMRPPTAPAPAPRPPGSKEALVAKLHAAGAGTGDIEALMRSLKPPPPPPAED